MKAFSGLVAYYELSLILYGVSVWTHSQNKLLLQNIASSHMMHICSQAAKATKYYSLLKP